tara:strand:+ start:10318 stop:10524 length:207 start_codon:yes stop_codon:yes gene_type:complete
MNQKIKLPEIFLEWFKQTNPHLYVKGVTKKERDLEIEEYISDVLHEHMELMENDFSDEEFEDGQGDYE